MAVVHEADALDAKTMQRFAHWTNLSNRWVGLVALKFRCQFRQHDAAVFAVLACHGGDAARLPCDRALIRCRLCPTDVLFTWMPNKSRAEPATVTRLDVDEID